MPSLSPAFFEDEERRQQEEELRRQQADAEAQQAQQTQPQQPQTSANPSNKRTPRDVAYDPEVKKADAERGWVTETGEFLQKHLDPLNKFDNFVGDINTFVQSRPELKDTVVGQATQAASDFVPNRNELDEKLAKVPVVGQIRAAGAGADAFVATPFTLAARFTNQDASEWAEPPDELKDVWGGEVAFELGRLLTPALLGFGLAGAAAGGANAARSGLTTLVAESGLETINQRSADDLILGRETAIKMGEAADLLGYDGAQLTQDLIEGRKPHAQAIVAVAGFLQNFGINKGADELFFQVSKQLGKKTTSEVAEEVAQATGKSADEVQSSLDNVEMPVPNRDVDISEAKTINTGVPKAPEGQSVNPDAAMAAALRREAPHLTDKSVKGFTNYQVFTKDTALQRQLEEVMNVIVKLEPGSSAYEKVFRDADTWLRQFIDETNSSIDLNKALNDLPTSEMVQPLQEFIRRDRKTGEQFIETGNPKITQLPLKTESNLPVGSIATEPGAVALTIIGEELGQRIQVAARNVTDLENGSKNFNSAVENFLDLLDQGELFMMPLRRYKQRWNLGGVAQQGGFKDKLKSSLGVKDAKGVKRNLTDFSPAEDFRKIYKDADAVGQTPRELWEAYKAGDADAGETLKQFMNLVSYAPPSTALAQIDNLEKALFDQLKQGNKNATTQLLYAGYLTRVAPQTASLASNLLNVVKEPIGLALAGEGRYALGEVFGAVSAFSDSLRIAKRVFQNGVPINTGNKLDAAVYDARLIDNKLEALWEGTQKELTASKAGKREWVTAWMSYTRQKIANHPLNSIAGRALMAGDEASKVLYGSMVASGRAMREAGEKGIKRGSAEFKDLMSLNYKEVFLDGVKNGELNPQSGVSDAAAALTFSQPIPKNGNVIDGAFRNLQDAAQENEFWKFVSPFTRVSYWTLEKGGIMLAGSIPGVGGKLLMNLVPRYKKIMAGEMGELAQLQLKSNFHFAGYTAFGVGSLAGLGMMTGSRPPEGMPATSFIIPANNKDGYVAIPYGRLEPVATAWAVIADLVQNFRDNVITEKDYNKAIEEIVLSMGLATLDKSFMTGMSNTAGLLDVNNFGEGTLVQGVNAVSPIITSRVLPIGAGAALTRMIADIAQPYDTISKGDPNLIRNIFAGIAERNFGGLTNPKKFNPLTGEPLQTTGQVGKDNYWKGVIGTIVNEFFVPGRVKTGQHTEILKQLERSGYDLKRLYNFRTHAGVALSIDEQEILSKDTHDIGKLPTLLSDYFNSNPYKWSLKLIKKMRERGDTDSLLAADKELQKVHSEISARFNQAKERAGREGRLKDEPGFQTKQGNLLNPGSPGQTLAPEVQELIQLPYR